MKGEEFFDEDENESLRTGGGATIPESPEPQPKEQKSQGFGAVVLAFIEWIKAGCPIGGPKK